MPGMMDGMGGGMPMQGGAPQAGGQDPVAMLMQVLQQIPPDVLMQALQLLAGQQQGGGMMDMAEPQGMPMPPQGGGGKYKQAMG